MKPEVTFHRLARADLFDIYDYVAAYGSAAQAFRFIARIKAASFGLAHFPEKGVPRDDIAAGIRTWSLERRVLIAYRTDGTNVEILRVLYAGRDFRSADIPD